ncbi:MFS transporter [Rhodococcus sp. 14C212]|uniref:MFS transporter n=1 Tax=Rhodococcus sp. 14C212 TaxID=2711209 RepID=UPI0013EAF1A5|nr:MFS transporter [Rhodococcus sp. 14C212]NGP08210.1 MFS transporter [Rhodococcus sp. 14C212]
MESQSQVPVRIGPLLAVLSGAPFVASLDLFVLNVALGDIGTSYPGSSLGELSWVLSGYAIVYAALLVPLGRWADRIGRRRGFLVGLGLFTAASAACALSPSLWVLVVCRLFQAVGAAALTPAALGLLVSAVPEARRAGAVRIWAATGAAAAAFGPVVGGLLVEVSWRWAFLINVPIGILLLVVALRVVPDLRPVDTGARLDLAGAALLTLGIGALALGLVQGPEWGWADVRIVAAFVVAVGALLLFAHVDARHPAPLIEPSLLAVRPFSWSNVTALIFSATFAAGLLANVLWVQQVWGYSALRTGLAVAPGPLMVPLFAAVGQVLARRFTPGAIAAAGCVLWGAGAGLVLATVGPEPEYVTALLPGWLLGGVGVGLALPTILSAATAQLPPARTATGSAIVTMSRQLGTVLGISVLVAILGAGDDAVSAFRFSWWTIAAVAVVAALAAGGMNPRPSTPEVKVLA